MLNWSDISILYQRELRSALRERTIVLNSILLPIFMYPLILWLAYTGISFVSGQTEGFTARVMLRNPQEAQRLLKIDLERNTQFELKPFENPEAAIRDDKLDLLAEFLPPDPAAPLKDNYKIRLTYDSSKDRSNQAKERLTERLSHLRTWYLQQEAAKIGLSPGQLQQFWVETKNVSSSRQMGQFILGLMLPIFMIIMLTMGAISPAIDSTAGEREKSTWETMLTTATSRTNIIVAKYLYVSTLSCLAGILNLAAMLFSMRAILAPLLGERSNELAFQLPLNAIPLIILLTILLAFLVSAGMMILASFARTYKEGQSMIAPLMMVIMMPMMLLQVPGLEFSLPLALVPIVNVTMVFREAIAGIFHWSLIGVTLAVEVACVALALWVATKILRYEDFLIGSYGGKFGKFLKERLIGKKKSAGGVA